MVTNRELYLKNMTKEVTLKSGNTFLIRKINPRNLVKTGTNLPIHTTDDLTGKNDEKTKIILEKMSAEEYANLISYGERVIISSSIEPKIVATDNGVDIPIEALDETDFWELLNEIQDFSRGGAREELASFRQESQPDSPRQSSQTVRNETK